MIVDPFSGFTVGTPAATHDAKLARHGHAFYRAGIIAHTSRT
jgi:hypothetical protein